MKKLLLLACIVFMFGCDKNDNNGKSKYYPVDYTIPASQMTHLETTGYPNIVLRSHEVGETLGCDGLVLVYLDGEIIAFDAACPVEWTPGIILWHHDPSSYYIFECSVCGNKFLLNEGGVSTTDKSLKLKKYKVKGNKVTN